MLVPGLVVRHQQAHAGRRQLRGHGHHGRADAPERRHRRHDVRPGGPRGDRRVGRRPGPAPRAARPVAIAPSGAGSLILGGLAVVTVSVAVGTLGRRLHASSPARWTSSSAVPTRSPSRCCWCRRSSSRSSSSPSSRPTRSRTALIAWTRVAAVTAGLGRRRHPHVVRRPAGRPRRRARPRRRSGSAGAARDRASPRSAAPRRRAPRRSSRPSRAHRWPPSPPESAPRWRLVLATVGRTPDGTVAGRIGAPLPCVGLSWPRPGARRPVAASLWVAVPVLLARRRPRGRAAPSPRSRPPPPSPPWSPCLPRSGRRHRPGRGLAALWLAVAGFAVCASALVNESRRNAVWRRMCPAPAGDLGTPGRPRGARARGLHAAAGRRPCSHSAAGGCSARPPSAPPRRCLPGLLLGTIPSLLWVVGDPVSLRALVLGAACLVLTIAGAALRWSAPLLVGASVGAAIVVRELGPYAGDFPKWVWIGLAGALLTVVGITWERRLLEVRKAVGFLGRLR